jgi:hypothetical protein
MKDSGPLMYEKQSVLTVISEEWGMEGVMRICYVEFLLHSYWTSQLILRYWYHIQCISNFTFGQRSGNWNHGMSDQTSLSHHARRSIRYHHQQRVCYRCHLPNGYEDQIHPTFKPNSPDCKYEDLLAPLALALYRHPLKSLHLENQFEVPLPSLPDFIVWLNSPPPFQAIRVISLWFFFDMLQLLNNPVSYAACVITRHEFF